jgi:hypothetical protein
MALVLTMCDVVLLDVAMLIEITDQPAERLVRATDLATDLGGNIRNLLDADIGTSYRLKNGIRSANTRGPIAMVEERLLQLRVVRSDGDGAVGLHIGFVDDERAASLESSNDISANALTLAVCMYADPEAMRCFLALGGLSYSSQRALGHDTVGSSGIRTIDLLSLAATLTTSVTL